MDPRFPTRRTGWSRGKKKSAPSGALEMKEPILLGGFGVPREDEFLTGTSGSCGIAELLLGAAGGDLLDGTVAQNQVASVLVNARGVADRGGQSAFGVRSGYHNLDALGGGALLAIERRTGAAHAVGHVTIATQDGLRLLFIGVQAQEVAHALVRISCRSAVGGEHGAPAGSRLFLGVRRAENDLRGAQLVGHHCIHGPDGIGSEVHSAGRSAGEVRATGGSQVVCSATFRNRHVPREATTVVRGENAAGKTDVLEIVDAGDAVRLGLGLGQGGQKHAGKDRDDRDHHEKLDQCESADLLLTETIHNFVISCGVK